MRILRNYWVSLLILILLIPNFLMNSSTVKASSAVDVTNSTVSEVLLHTQNYMYKHVKNPGFGDEWYVFSLARGKADIPQSYYETYYENLVETVRSMNGILHKQKYTEYARVIIALSSIGKNAENVGGFNLIERLYDFDSVKRQGINGPIFALIALDTGHYEIPEGVSNSRQKMLDYIVSRQLPDGGFALGGENGDPDVTAMALQALSTYTHQPVVKETVNGAVQFLSEAQKSDGSYFSGGIANAESVSQVVIALTSLGVHPQNDARFVKEDGLWTMSNLLSFYNSEEGAFHHTIDGEINSMATEQASLALVSYERYVKGQTRLFDLSDVVVQDMIAPNIKLYAVSDKSTQVKGITEAGATVELYVNGKKKQTLVAGSDGWFSFAISPLKAGMKVRATAIDQAGNSQKTENIVVTDKTAPEKPSVNKVTIHSTAVTGKAEANSTVFVYKGKTKLGSVKANSKGEFYVKIQKQKQGTKLSVYAEDVAKNRSENTTVNVVNK